MNALSKIAKCDKGFEITFHDTFICMFATVPELFFDFSVVKKDVGWSEKINPREPNERKKK